MKRYSVIYKLRGKKLSPVTGMVMEGYKLLEIRERFNKEIQEYRYGIPKYAIIDIRVLR